MNFKLGTLRQRLMVGVVVCAVLDAALVAWLLSPQAPSRAASDQQRAQARTQLIAMRAQSQALGRLQDRIRLSQQQIEELEAEGIPEVTEASSKLLSEFNRIANVSQVTVANAEFHPDKDAKLGLRRIAITLQVSGSYGGVVRFLNQVERSNMFFLINQVSVSGGRATPGTAEAGPIKLDVQLESYAREDGGGPKA